MREDGGMNNEKTHTFTRTHKHTQTQTHTQTLTIAAIFLADFTMIHKQIVTDRKSSCDGQKWVM